MDNKGIPKAETRHGADLRLATVFISTAAIAGAKTGGRTKKKKKEKKKKKKKKWRRRRRRVPMEVGLRLINERSV